MASINITPGTLTNYRNETAQSGDTVYVGWNGTAHYRLKLKLSLSRTLKSLDVTIAMRSTAGSAAGTGTFLAGITQTNSNAPPTQDTSFKFSDDSNRSGSFTITKSISSGDWYLWVWQTFTDHVEILSGDSSEYPVWDIIGVTGGAVPLYINGAWQNAEAYIHNGTAWQEPEPYAHNGTTWEEMS